MNKILLLCGESGCGKTTLANQLAELFGLSVLPSYTTRPKRTNNEKGHIFLNDEEFSNIKIKDIAAYSEFNGYKYCATQQQIEQYDVYIVDKVGIETLKKRYKGNKKYIICYIKTDTMIRKNRMLQRGDNIEDVISRLCHDKKAFCNIEEMADIVIDNNDNNNVSNIHKLWTIFLHN